jgi:hypothetical protein
MYGRHAQKRRRGIGGAFCCFARFARLAALNKNYKKFGVCFATAQTIKHERVQTKVRYATMVLFVNPNPNNNRRRQALAQGIWSLARGNSKRSLKKDTLDSSSREQPEENQNHHQPKKETKHVRFQKDEILCTVMPESGSPITREEFQLCWYQVSACALLEKKQSGR